MFAEIGELLFIFFSIFIVYYFWSGINRGNKKKDNKKSYKYRKYSDAEKLKYYQDKNRREKKKYRK